MAQTLLRVSTGNEEIGRYVNEEEQRSCACSHLQLLCYLRLSMELQLQHTTHCNCDGTADCRDMRKSGMCKDDVLSCRGSPPYCTCDAARRLLGGSRVTSPPQRSPGTVK
jgi:hypothetical protein